MVAMEHFSLVGREKAEQIKLDNVDVDKECFKKIKYTFSGHTYSVLPPDIIFLMI